MSKYLDKFGLEHYHDLIKSGLFEYIVGTQSSATSTWTGVSTQPDLFAGKLIIYHLPYAGASAVPTLNLTLPDGTTTGAKTVGSRAGTNYAAGNNLVMVFTGTEWDPISVTAEELGYLSGLTGNIQEQLNGKYSKTLTSEIANFYALDSTATPDDVLTTIGDKLLDLTDWTVEKITESTVWTAPKAFHSKFKVFAVGGGGGGGVAKGRFTPTSSTYTYYSGGGGGGGYVEVDELTIQEGTEVVIVCGAGGSEAVVPSENPVTGAEPLTAAGGDGGTSSFGTYITANGGKGGDGLNGGDGGAGGGGAVMAKSSASPYSPYCGSGGDGGVYGGGGGVYTSGQAGTGGTYGGDGGNPSVEPTAGTPHDFTEEETLYGYGGTFNSTGEAGTGNGTLGGGSGGYGGNGGNLISYNSNPVSYIAGGGGGGFGGNGGEGNGYVSGSSSHPHGGGGGGGNYGGNGGNGKYNSTKYKTGAGGGGGFLCDGADGQYLDAAGYGGGGGGGILPGNASNGGDGGVYILYKKIAS